VTTADLAAARAYLGRRRRLSHNPASVQAIDAALLCVEMVMLASADAEGAMNGIVGVRRHLLKDD